MTDIFTLPDVGEGLTEAEILSWKVAPGHTVESNQVIVEIETAKSVVELPSPFAGTVRRILAEEGQTVEVGAPLIEIAGADAAEDSGDPEAPAGAAEEADGAGPGDRSAPVGAPGEAPDAAGTGRHPETTGTAGREGGSSSRAPGGSPADSPAGSPAGSEGGAALVGSGPKADPVRRRARKRPSGVVEPSPAPQTPPTPPAEEHRRGPLAGLNSFSAGTFGANLAERARDALNRLPGRSHDEPMPTPDAHQRVPGEPPRRPTLAKPPVRKAAKDLGIDLADVPGTGAQGQVTQKDLINYAANSQDLEAAKPEHFWIPQGRGGDRLERVPVKGVRKVTAKAMVKSAFEAPHVSIFVDVDASRTMEFVKRLKASPSFEGVKVTPLLILAKAIIWATARNPQVNSSWTDSEILIKRYINLGIAAATPRGLMVPNIKDAQELSLRELAVAIQVLTKTAREGKTQPGDMTGGTLTITNIGALGIDTGTPIINPGEAAIVAFGTIKQKPWVVDGEVIPRWVTTLGGSFDHRIVDGDLSARFMADVASVLEEPALLLDM
ncbi:dihydrolipoamide acetyltransferase family protein [Rothia kristinae]|uniref:dihydrolipoamide acetyltransferase family protein n=1 Tax=Rothia kristinae TaxID=37923 RepID=UPI0007732F3B|nr:dihydrolipoamide acetyltransferase family protein [Rothia kristinae]MED6046567.1 dihydrolipoamide acetyltransferase family protein [Rothia kristinae]SQC29996.1 Dihydrolipoyllysine-residue acetyltransferase component of pyruvate dehydrogenase complex [Rothia kristinae]